MRMKAQALWSQIYGSDTKNTITAVQTLRNALMTGTFLASTAALLATQVFGALLDPPKLGRVQQLGEQDVITGGTSLFSATAKLSIIIACLLVAFFWFTQAVRLYSHMGFLVGMLASPLNTQHAHVTSVEELVALSDKAAICFSLGIRTFVFFGPLILWVLGPTMMLIATLCLTAGMVWADRLPTGTRLVVPGERAQDLER
ncbi:hypothetical protein C2E20_6785 [Micractinium conductrix]|uniref:DUF599 domain-containing protein n=1 Tax=Micractinium conductrix TaxID=554055 RepID=A0A2P6V6R3_9CHLO|nr:hypothetical protein C2E20_6785 [Micractinium conductrix]|eukprot:PSC69771.1 hypothetical protein C2E20_6785 [Micractinium conductrix]